MATKVQDREQPAASAANLELLTGCCYISKASESRHLTTGKHTTWFAFAGPSVVHVDFALSFINRDNRRKTISNEIFTNYGKVLIQI